MITLNLKRITLTGFLVYGLMNGFTFTVQAQSRRPPNPTNLPFKSIIGADAKVLSQTAHVVTVINPTVGGSIKEPAINMKPNVILSLNFTDHSVGTYITEGTIRITRVNSSTVVLTSPRSFDGDLFLTGSLHIFMNDPDFGRVTFDVPLNSLKAHLHVTTMGGFAILNFTLPKVVDSYGVFYPIREETNYSFKINLIDNSI